MKYVKPTITKMNDLHLEAIYLASGDVPSGTKPCTPCQLGSCCQTREEQIQKHCMWCSGKTYDNSWCWYRQ